MKYLKNIMLCFIFSSFFYAVSFAMDRGELAQHESADQEMVALEESDDVKQFAGKLSAKECTQIIFCLFKARSIFWF